MQSEYKNEVINMLKVKFILKNKEVIDFECEEFSSQRSNIDGSLAGYTFKGANKEKGYPLYVAIGDISAIVVKDEPEDNENIDN